MESYSVEAILSAVDKNFSSTMKNADSSMNNLDNSTQKTNTSILDIAKGIGVFKLVDNAIGLVTSSLGGAIDRFDTLNKYPVVMQALGYSTDDVDKSMNKLTDGIDGLPTSLDEIVSSAQQLAISTGDLQKGTDTAIALNNAFLASGASSADASRGAQQYQQMLSKGEVDLQSWRSLLETMPIAMDKVSKSFSDQGVNSANDLYAALKKGDITFEDFNSRLIELNEGVGGFAELAKKNSSGIRTSFANIKTAVVKGLANVITAIDEGMQNAGLGSIAENFDKIKGAVNVAFKAITDSIPPAISFLTNLWNTIKPFLPLIMAVVGYISIYQGVMGTARKAVELYNGAQKMMNVLMNLNPIGLIIAAVIALVAGFIYLWNTSEEFRNFWIGLWETIKSAVGTAIDWIVSAWDGISEWFKQSWDGVSDWFGKLWQGIADTASKAWSAIREAPSKAADWIMSKWEDTKLFFADVWSGIKNGAADIWDGILSAASDAWDSVVNVLSPYVEAITGLFEPLITFFSNLWSQIGEIAGAAWEVIKTIVMGPILLLIDLVLGNFEQLKTDAATLWTTLTENIQIIISTFIDIVVGYYTALKDTVINIWTAISTTIQNLWTSFTTWISETTKAIVDGVVQAWEGFKQSVVDLFNATVQGANDTWQAFKEWFKNLVDTTVQNAKQTWENFKQSTIDIFNSLVEGAKQTWENLKQGTIDIFNGLVDGAKQAWENLVESVTGLIDDVTGWFNKLKDINLLDIGKAIMDGFLKGLKEKYEGVKDFIGGIGDWIRDHKGPIRVDKKLLIPAGNAIMEGLNNGLDNGFGAVQDNVSSMGDRLSTNFDIGSRLTSINSQIQTKVQHEVSYGTNSKPAQFNVRIGNSEFSAFLDDISQAQGNEINLNMQF
ncbi:tape measure protein [Enterococcus casseliflavus]|uniref:phage tail protein n=1 Tax=Enterococcus casseliflavus TaxID=37734 RepID=UPI001919FBDC|nr:tape measure protein [Enterococcus casseliflavus]QQU17903.1 tape measure protein [Enterococcus casseliflavus]